MGRFRTATPEHAAKLRENGKKGRAMKGAKWPVPLKVRERLKAIQLHAEIDAAATVEQIARGALYDPRDYYYAEGGWELYESDGPLKQDVLGGWSPSWKKGEIKRTWAKGDLKPIHELTEAQAQCIVGVEVVMKNAVAGDGQIDRVLKYRFAPREKYVELAARYHGMLLDRSELTVNVQAVGAKLDEARQTWANLQVIEAKALPEPSNG